MKTSFRFLFSVLGLIIGVIFLSFYLRVREVSCLIAETEHDNAPVCRQLKSLIGGKLLFRDFYTDEEVLNSTIIAETKEVFSLVKIDVSINGKIVFHLSQTSPLYRFVENGEKRIFTEFGQSRADDSSIILPEIIDEAHVFVDNFDHYHLFITEFLKSVGTDAQVIEQIKFFTGNKVRLILTGYPDFILDPLQDPVEQGKKFQIIYQQLDPKEIDILLQEIDLRFELPVLKTYESSDSAQLLIDSQE